jgi:PAS domain S-box-containing protein
MPERTLDPILQQVTETVYVRDLEMNVVYMNEAAEHLVGRRFAEARSLKCYEVFGDEGGACRHSCPGERSIATRTPLSHHEGKLKAKDGRVLDMRVSISPRFAAPAADGAAPP